MAKLTSLSAKIFAKHTVRQTWSTALVVTLLFSGISVLVWAFSGPPAGCTPTSCPANPLKIDFIGGKVKIGDAGQTKEFCLNGICKNAWPSAGATASTGEYQLGPMVWSGVIAGDAAKTQAEGFALCSALGAGWRLPSNADWDVAKSYAGGATNLNTVLALNNLDYLSSSNFHNNSGGISILIYTNNANGKQNYTWGGGGSSYPVRCVKTSS